MKTEITENKKVNGWVLYDADCRFCVWWARRFETALACREFKLLPLQSPWVREHLGLTESDELLAEMRLMTNDGRKFAGVDALIEICRYFRLAWPFRQLARCPEIYYLMQRFYRWVARHRPCAKTADDGRKKGRQRARKRIVFLELP